MSVSYKYFFRKSFFIIVSFLLCFWEIYYWILFRGQSRPKVWIRSSESVHMFTIVFFLLFRGFDRSALKLSMEDTRLAAIDAGARPNESSVGFTRLSLLYRVDLSLWKSWEESWTHFCWLPILLLFEKARS